MVATLIQSQIDAYDAYHRPDPDVPDDLETPTDNVHFTIGSKLREITYATLLEQDPARFARFHIRVSEFMSNLLPASGIPLPEGRRISYTAADSVSFHLTPETFSTHIIVDYSIPVSEGELRVT